MRPQVPPTVEWHLQERILATARFTEQAMQRGLTPKTALRVAAEEVVSALVATLAAAAPEAAARDGSPPSRTPLVARALERIEAALDEPVSISAVCRELGTSERTLLRAFDEILGVGPRAYERERRLRRVHGVILAEGDRRSITDIAMSFGFWHLGRFAGAYAALYGCSPRETRRRAWGEGAARMRVGSP
jgi:transcriptional regulator GlxA family with amidase domain